MILFLKLISLVFLIIKGFNIEAFELEDVAKKDFNLSSEAYSYLEETIKIMEQGSVNRQQIDWASLRMKVYEKAANACSPSETYEAIRLAISLLEDNHSFFLTPEQVKFLENKDTAESGQLIQFHSKLIDSEIGYLLIPSCSSLSEQSLKAYASKIQQEIQSLDRHKVKKWIVDLRGNSGGNMWPMVLGLKPLIGDHIFGFFSNGSEDRVSWNFEGKSLKFGDFEACSLEEPSYQLYQTQPWIAVLIDNETCSSGEATTVAFLGGKKTRIFGKKTGGFTSANEFIRLNNGAAIFLATAYLADRLGRIYTDGIIPDEILEEEGDAVLKAAIQWLEKNFE